MNFDGRRLSRSNTFTETFWSRL
jgi:hypothetical protein